MLPLKTPFLRDMKIYVIVDLMHYKEVIQQDT